MMNGDFLSATDTLVRDILTRCMERIKSEMTAKGVNASGRTSAALQVVRSEDGWRLQFGAGDVAPAPTLEVGREGGNVPKGFTAILVEWSRAKGIQFASDRERRTFAYLLGQRIKREGTRRHKEHVDIYSSAVADAVKELREKLPRITLDIIKLHL